MARTPCRILRCTWAAAQLGGQADALGSAHAGGRRSGNDRPAAQFGSEGQKRTLAIALKMAQAEYLAGSHGAPPILLIDDVMGELDARRGAGFLPLLERTDHARGQVFMTCTEENWPQELGRKLQRWEVREGQLKRLD